MKISTRSTLRGRELPGYVTTWAEVNLKAVAANYRALEKIARKNRFNLPTRPTRFKQLKNPPCLLPVVKADAYGHGVLPVARILVELGAHALAVSDIQEGVQLREAGVTTPILIFESPLPQNASSVYQYDLIPTVCTIELARALDREGRRRNRRLRVHLKVDTGMGRLGVDHADADAFVRRLFQLRHIIIEGIYTHFPLADEDPVFTEGQIETLYSLVTRLDKSGMVIPYIHASNSMGLAGYKTHVLNLFRPGLMLYGTYPHPSLRKKINLRPAMSVKSKVIFLKTLKKGRGVSYGWTFIAPRDMEVATVPIGYHDGYLRSYSNKAHVLIDGEKCPVIGNVTMDQMVVDVSRVRRPRLGMSVVVMGRQKGREITAEDLARWSGSINYEVLCNFGNILPLRYRP